MEISSCMLLFMVAIAGAFVGTFAQDYCNLASCVDINNVRQPHTMCTYTSSQPSSNCGQWRDAGLSDAEKSEIVNLHNKLRRNVAAGQESRGNPGPQPAAAEMPDLTWDDELATVAQRWVNQCDYNHDSCRDVARFQVGQNLARTGSSGVNVSKVGYMVQLWYNEVDNVSQDMISSLPDDINSIGHYTQLVYGKTTKVGCGRIFYKQPGDNMERHMLACNYGPAGNYPGDPVYKIKG